GFTSTKIQPKDVDPGQRSGQTEPGPSVTQVVVAEIDAQGARAGKPAGRDRPFHVDIEGGDLAPSANLGHGTGVAHEPGFAGRVAVRHEQTGLLGPAQIADNLAAAADPGILSLWRHPARIHDNGLAPWQACRREYEIAG